MVHPKKTIQTMHPSLDIILKEKRILMCPVSSGGQERREDYYVSANKKKRQG